MTRQFRERLEYQVRRAEKETSMNFRKRNPAVRTAGLRVTAILLTVIGLNGPTSPDSKGFATKNAKQRAQLQAAESN